MGRFENRFEMVADANSYRNDSRAQLQIQAADLDLSPKGEEILTGGTVPSTTNTNKEEPQMESEVPTQTPAERVAANLEQKLQAIAKFASQAKVYVHRTVEIVMFRTRQTIALRGHKARNVLQLIHQFDTNANKGRQIVRALKKIVYPSKS